MRFYLSRLIWILLGVVLVVPAALSLLLSFFLWAASPLKSFHVNALLYRGIAWIDNEVGNRTADWLFWLARKVMGTQAPRVEEVKE